MHATNQARRFARLVVASAALSVALSAQSAAGEPTPGSLLFFPEFENENGAMFLVTVTNTNPTEEILSEWVYVDGDDCTVLNRAEILTPNDTLTVLVGVHNPIHERGFLYVYATEAIQNPIVFEYLIGTSTRIDGIDAFDYSVDPIAFHGVGAHGDPTDLDGDGIRDLDGLEYSRVADELLVPRFLGQGGMLGMQSSLVLVNLSGGTGFTASVNFLVYNDNEEVFSTEYLFQCWTEVPLLDISGVFDQDFLSMFTNQDPDEILGAPQLESGWFRVDGNVAESPNEVIVDPAILGFLLERPGGQSGAAELPFGSGQQDNGALLQLGIGAGPSDRADSFGAAR